MDWNGYGQAVFDWTEKHAGLGGWVGAIGSVLAIFVAWSLARAEYKRSVRRIIARRNAELDVIWELVGELDDHLRDLNSWVLTKDVKPWFERTEC
jgi:hypothetical protein